MRIEEFINEAGPSSGLNFLAHSKVMDISSSVRGRSFALHLVNVYVRVLSYGHSSLKVVLGWKQNKMLDFNKNCSAVCSKPPIKETFDRWLLPQFIYIFDTEILPGAGWRRFASNGYDMHICIHVYPTDRSPIILWTSLQGVKGIG